MNKEELAKQKYPDCISEEDQLSMQMLRGVFIAGWEAKEASLTKDRFIFTEHELSGLLKKAALFYEPNPAPFDYHEFATFIQKLIDQLK